MRKAVLVEAEADAGFVLEFGDEIGMGLVKLSSDDEASDLVTVLGQEVETREFGRGPGHWPVEERILTGEASELGGNFMRCE